MDYDIRIVHSDDSYSFYSKVCEEKSGGETQTPFYVTVAASFVQLYGNNIGGEAIGLVMFDEAFNNMDDERIGGVLEFLRRLPLQIIIAAPPDKIQYISPGVEVEYVRPPYGSWDKSFEENMIPILWTIDPLDWCGSNVGCITERIVDKAGENEIILMHDYYDTFVTAALKVVDELLEEGYVFVTVEEILFE